MPQDGCHRANLRDQEELERLRSVNTEMLAALRDCLEHCEREGGPDIALIRDDNSGHMLNVEMIRAAIAKAEGA